MSVLNILDINSFLYTAHNVPELSSLSVRNCPVGGMKYITRKISYLLMRGESVVCAFDSRTNRKLLYPEYKKQRKKVPEVNIQSEFLLKTLTDAGVCCIKVKGLEADDIIYNVIEKEKNNFMSINIHSADYDLCHNVIAGKVNFFSVNRNVMCVNGNTFSEVLSNAEVRVPYNMITAKKVFCGDSSDNIGAFTSSDGRKGSMLFTTLVDLVFDNQTQALPVEVLRSRQLIETMINFMGFSEEDKVEIKKRCDLFYPIEQDIDFTPTNSKNINMSYYLGFLKSIKDIDSCKTLKYWGDSNKTVDEQLFQYGNAFKSGEYHVDNNLSLDNFSLEESSVFLRGL